MHAQLITFITLIAFFNTTIVARAADGPGALSSTASSAQSSPQSLGQSLPTSAGRSVPFQLKANDPIPSNSEIAAFESEEPIEIETEFESQPKFEVMGFTRNLSDKRPGVLASTWATLNTKIADAKSKSKNINIVAVVDDGTSVHLTSLEKAKIDISFWQKTSIVLCRSALSGGSLFVSLYFFKHMPLAAAIQVGFIGGTMSGFFAANAKFQSWLLGTSFLTNSKLLKGLKNKNTRTSKVIVDTLDMGEALTKFLIEEIFFVAILNGALDLSTLHTPIQERIWDYIHKGFGLKMEHNLSTASWDTGSQGTGESGFSKAAEHRVEGAKTKEQVQSARRSLMLSAMYLSMVSVLASALDNGDPLATILNIKITIGKLIFIAIGFAGLANFVRVKNNIREENQIPPAESCAEAFKPAI